MQKLGSYVLNQTEAFNPKKSCMYMRTKHDIRPGRFADFSPALGLHQISVADQVSASLPDLSSASCPSSASGELEAIVSVLKKTGGSLCLSAKPKTYTAVNEDIDIEVDTHMGLKSYQYYGPRLLDVDIDMGLNDDQYYGPRLLL